MNWTEWINKTNSGSTDFLYQFTTNHHFHQPQNSKASSCYLVFYTNQIRAFILQSFIFVLQILQIIRPLRFNTLSSDLLRPTLEHPWNFDELFNVNTTWQLLSPVTLFIWLQNPTLFVFDPDISCSYHMYHTSVAGRFWLHTFSLRTNHTQWAIS